MAPDAHTDHYGAWPADGFYGDVDGVWTDVSVDESGARRDENKNIPGDGKFDQTTWPSDVDWMIGRVDLSRLPQFDLDEESLTARYFEKNHRFRMGEVHRSGAMIDDHFGFFNGEAFASTGWALSPVVGRDQIREGDWLTDLSAGEFLWAYGCGAGSYTSAGGVGKRVATLRRRQIKPSFPCCSVAILATGMWRATSCALHWPPKGAC